MNNSSTALVWSACTPSSTVEEALRHKNPPFDIINVSKTSKTDASTSGSLLISLSSATLAQVATHKPFAVIIEPQPFEAFQQQQQKGKAAVTVREYLEDVHAAIDPWMDEMIKAHPDVFVVVVSHPLVEYPLARQVLISGVGTHMLVGSSATSTTTLLDTLSSICHPEHNVGTALVTKGTLTCPICAKKGLTPKGLYLHLPQYHGNVPFSRHRDTRCPICKDSFSQSDLVNHFFHEHPPSGPPIPERIKVSLYTFALVVTRRKKDGKFLMVQEFCNQGYWLPGGGVDPGECPIKGGVRETLEEAGVHVEIKGIINVSMQPSPKVTRLTFIFYAEPVDDNAEAKAHPDFESVGAAWVSLDELMSGELALRGKEPLRWFPHVANGGDIHPLSLLDVYCRK